MARQVDPKVAKAELENLLQGVAKQLIHRVYGPDGIPRGTKFADLEELAVQLGQAVSESMIDFLSPPIWRSWRWTAADSRSSTVAPRRATRSRTKTTSPKNGRGIGAKTRSAY
jgi:hypothetical protein